MLRYLPLALVLLLFTAKPADAHFFGAAKDVNGFQVVFAPYPDNPAIGQTSSLNFSVLQNGANLYNIYAAVKVQNSNGTFVLQEPYRQYEISDISVPYVFKEPGDYKITIEARIPDDVNQTRQLAATFGITIFSGLPLDELLLYYVAPASAAITGIVVYLHSKKMI